MSQHAVWCMMLASNRQASLPLHQPAQAFCAVLSQPYSTVCHREWKLFIQRKQSLETWQQKKHYSTRESAEAWWSLVLFHFVCFFFDLFGVCCLWIDCIVVGNTSLFWEKEQKTENGVFVLFVVWTLLKMSVFINLLGCYLPLRLC